MLFSGEGTLGRLSVESVSRDYGTAYIGGVDAVFADRDKMSDGERRKMIDAAEVARKIIVDEEKTTKVCLNIQMAKDIKERLEEDEGYGFWLGRFKEMLEVEFGKVVPESDKQRALIVGKGREAAVKLFFVDNPGLEFSIV